MANRAESLGPRTKRVGERLRRRRQERELTLQSLAAELAVHGYSVDPSTLAKMEKGHRRIDADDLIMLSLVLGVSPSWLLLSGDDPRSPHDNEVRISSDSAEPAPRTQRRRPSALDRCETFERSHPELPSACLRFQECASTDNSYVGLVGLRDYQAFLTDERGALREVLFYSDNGNHRHNAGINDAIRSVLVDPDAPDFWWLNNGITVMCSAASAVGKTFTMVETQIVNGHQTSFSVYDALRNLPDSHPAFDRSLLVRILVSGDATVRGEVASATNSATRKPVSDETVPIPPRRTRRQNAVEILLTARAITNGEKLWYCPTTERERSATADWLAASPDRTYATWIDDDARPLIWPVDGRRYSPSGLVQKIWSVAGWTQAPLAVRGTRCWRVGTEEGPTLSDIAAQLEVDAAARHEEPTGLG